MAYLRQRAEKNMKLKVEEKQAQWDVRVSFQQQQQQMLHAFQKQSEKQDNALLALSQEQRQQNQILLALLQNLVFKWLFFLSDSYFFQYFACIYVSRIGHSITL